MTVKLVRRVVRIVLIGGLLVTTPAAGPGRQDRRVVAAEIAEQLAAGTAVAGETISPIESRWFDELYAQPTTPLWIDGGLQANDAFRQALAILEHAGDDGLVSGDYQVARARTLAADLARADVAQAVQFERFVSLEMLRFLRDLHLGRVTPRSVGFHLESAADNPGAAGPLRAAVTAGQLANAVAALRPRFDQYAKLSEALARYRVLARDAAMATPIVFSGTIRPGDRLPPALAVHRRLVAFGDLPASTPLPRGQIYELPLVAGVRHFQTRHGLPADGVIGPLTTAAFNTSIVLRIRQIELALERLRWLPPLRDGPVIALNIPMFHLWGWDATPSNAPTLSLDAIVGAAFKTETPVFVDTMQHLVFRPYWNVPPSLLKRELLPAQTRDPRLFEREGFEIVRGEGASITVIPPTAQALRDLAQGWYRLRQRPGPRNPLGAIKFVFPNDANVYMHGTPAPELFARRRRDFSHGCIRLADPVSLAAWVLRGLDEWTPEAIVAATAGTDDVRVDLPVPIRVVIFYTTAAVPEDGTVHFADDIYGLDGPLDRALRAVSHAAR